MTEGRELGAESAVAIVAAVIALFGVVLILFNYTRNGKWPTRARSCWRCLCTYRLCPCCDRSPDDIRYVPGDFVHDDNMVPTNSLARVLGGATSMQSISNDDPVTLQLDILKDHFRKELIVDRNRLHFADSVGKGWFGWVIKGQYEGHWVTVQMLREEATLDERRRFLDQSLRVARSGGHENVLRMVGVAVDIPPLLAVYEHCHVGDLKTFLINGKDQISGSPEGNRLLLRFCKDITNGLNYLHNVEQIPIDLSTRSCHLTHDMTVKIGDHGLARSTHPGDYLSTDPATTISHSLAASGHEKHQRRPQSFLALRWLAPEVLERIQRGTVLTQLLQVSKQENIWSLGITFWEIGTYGQKQPFATLHDHQYLTAALIQPGASLEPVDFEGLEAEALQSVINMCTKRDGSQRPSCERLKSYLIDIYECEPTTRDF